MNILIYVITMLMLLTLLTYSRIESYRSFSVMEKQFVTYMETQERSFTNEKALARYNQTTVKKQTNPNKDSSPGTGRLNLSPLFAVSNENSELFLKTTELTKKLIIYLYRTQPFYIELAKERPGFVEDILKDLVRTNDQPEQAIKDAADLSNFQIVNDPALNLALYEILNGFPADSLPQSVMNTNPSPSVEDSDDSLDDNEVANEAYEAHSEAGTISILDYITIRKNSKTRIYLASRPLLQVIYDDPLIVEQIIETRNSIFHRLRNNPDEKKELTQKFEEQFKRGQALYYEQLLDFQVSGTNPKNYE